MKRYPAILLLMLLTSLTACSVSTTSSRRNPRQSTSSFSTSQTSTLESSSNLTQTTSNISSKSSSESTSSVSSLSTSNSNTTSATTSTQNSSSNTSTSTSEEPPEDDCDIISISLNKKEMDVIQGKRSDSLIVSYNLKDPSSEVDKSVEWSSSDPTIASIDEYGRVTGNKIGQTVVSATTVVGSRRASCVIYVVSSSGAYTIEWQKVTHQSSLMPGDQIVIACPQSGKAATSENTGMYLHSTDVSFTTSGDKITSLADDAEIFILDGEDGNWTLENEEGKYLATTHTGKVTFIYKTGNIHWDIDYDNEWNVCDMRSTSSIDGWFMYNAKADKFTTYESNEQVDMFLISLYKLIKIRNS